MPQITTSETCDVAILGAGVAGLAAAGELTRAGLRVVCLEARDRAGGRILTVHDPLSPIAIELGAEFVHGRPANLWSMIHSHNLLTYEHSLEAVHFDGHSLRTEKEVGTTAGDVLSAMTKSKRKKDESFEQYLHHSQQSSRAKAWARLQVEGFNAAERSKISAASLAEDAEAADKIDGDRVFKIPAGYDGIVLALLRAIPDHPSVIRLNAIATHVNWRKGHAQIRYKSPHATHENTLNCRHVIVTLPIGVLKARPSAVGAIRFQPEPRAILKAAYALEAGRVDRIVFRFREPFWNESKSLEKAGFLISGKTPFMSWWTTYPVISPVLTAWSAGSSAIGLGKMSQPVVAGEALRSLAQILRRKIPQPEAVYFQDWQADPFSRGAYSYVPVGATRHALARPVANTLYFAGEAASRTGRGGTVDGAIESGRYAAELILNR